MIVKYEKVPDEMATRYIGWKSIRDTWLAKANSDMEYAEGDVEGTGTLFTKATLERIKGLSNIPTSVNYIHPTVQQKMAIILRARPSHKVISASANTAGQAQLLDKMKHHMMYNSKSTEQLKQFVKNFLVRGMCGIFVGKSDLYRPGAFNTTLRALTPDRFIIDPNTSDETNDDAEGVFIETKITLKKAELLYGRIIDAINVAKSKREDGTDDPNFVKVKMEDFTKPITNNTGVGGAITTQQPLLGNNVKSVDVVEYYEPHITTAYYVEDKSNGDVLLVFKENSPDPDNDILFNDPIDQEPGVFVKKTLMLGNYVVAEEILPITALPVRIGYFNWNERPYKSRGMVHFAKGMQEAYDKTIQMMLVNGILQNNAGWTAPKDSIAPEDRAKWEEQGNDPRVIKEFTPVVIDGQVFKPEREKVQQLSNFYPMFLQMMKSGIEYVTGVNSIVQGDAREAGVEVFASLQQYQTAASERISMALASVNRVMESVGVVMVDYLIDELKPEETRSFFDEDGVFNEFTVAKDLKKTMRTTRFNVLSIPAEAMPTQRMAFGTELLKIAQTTPDPSERSLFVKEAIKLSDMHSARKLVQDLDTVRNLQSQVQQMQEAQKRSTEVMKQMENKALNADYRARLADMLLQSAVKIAQQEGKISAEMQKTLEEYRALQTQAGSQE